MCVENVQIRRSLGVFGEPNARQRKFWDIEKDAQAAAFAATRLPTDAGPGTLVDSDTSSYKATQQLRQTFGEEPIVILAEGDLQQLLLTDNLSRLLRLEGKNTPGELALDEFTGAEHTARVKLTLKKPSTEIRWEGTMYNDAPDGRVLPVFFSRRR